MKQTNKAGLYIHIPFCIKKCSYCDFFSRGYDSATAEKYVERLITEIAGLPETEFDTVFIGGGTPSILPKYLLERLCRAVTARVPNPVEFTIECNPATDLDFPFIESLGINRISLGVQSLNDNVLKVIGRRHDSKTALGALRAANLVFDNVSADLILGLPKQTIRDVENDISLIKDFVTHFSCYLLKIEESTPISKTFATDDDIQADFYDAALRHLEGNGFGRYEISNFAKPGFESKHNLKYWLGAPYIGVGAAAHSFYNGIRFENSRAIEYERINETRIEDREFEEIMLRLRLKCGIDIAAFNAKYNVDFKEKYKKQLQYLNGLLDVSKTNAAIKHDSFLLQSAIAREFLLL
ncbi:MAG: radical SAM family heme chaperone HemW [Christensenellaceae bacterium]|nr:radical SAM family heme chaperone HemW [Christensenellaceae bacterium]